MHNEIKESELGTALKELDPDFISGLDEDEQKRLAKALVSIETSHSLSVSQTRHSGPIPDPETLSRYAAIIPDGAERIMQMAEQQSNHRRSLEKTVVESQARISERGQWFAAVLSTLLIVAGA
jgi:uncharacterized membrane protein